MLTLGLKSEKANFDSKNDNIDKKTPIFADL